MTDVVVVGSGAAGMAAAVSAGLKGASVTVLEKAPLIGGTTSWGGGGIWIPANPYAAAEGSPGHRVEDALMYLRTVGSGRRGPRPGRALRAPGRPRAWPDVERHTPLRWNTIQPLSRLSRRAAWRTSRRAAARWRSIRSASGPTILRAVRPNPYGAWPRAVARSMAGIDAVRVAARGRARASSAKAWA